MIIIIIILLTSTWCVFIIISLYPVLMHLMCIHVSWDFSLHTWRFLLAYMEISPCIHGDFSFSLVRFSFIPVSILCVDHTISWCTTHLDSNILVLVITFLGVVSIPFLYLAWEISCPIYQVHTDCPHLSREKCRDFVLSAGDFFFSADDFLEIEIYYNKKHLFLENLFSRTTAVDFWILDLDFWSSRSRFLSLDLWLSLDFWILISGSLWSRFDFQILSKYNS